MTALRNIDRLPPAIRPAVASYLEEMLSLHAGNVLSVFLYGSAAGADYVPKHSDINLCFIFNKLDFEVLEKSLKTAAKGAKKKITAPLFFTPEMIAASSDVFPVEFLEMKEKHVLLYGEDLISAVDIKTEYLRLFCEEQLKGKLIRIRHACLETGLRPVQFKSLLRGSFKTLLPIFRNLIRLKGTHPPVKKEEIIKEMARHYDLDPAAFLAIPEKTVGKRSANSDELKILFRDFIRQLNELVQKVDRS